MSEEKFTKGPWKACEVSSGEWTVNCKGDYDDSSSDINEFSPTVCDMWNVTYAADLNKSQKANAHLIAAAPEMYEILDSLSKMSSEDAKLYLESSSDLVDLLAKARGEQC